ncbi:ABC transporter substrate-binding protein [Ignatzschineria rhizosphaerae]|uniref:ABC transporter substrate-binding protein n=1 Tax=Ignatzschineria rhizosphaerae TaxID=2923279 RepID=A0ABY3X3C9_9GAMM|nr:ABC transporter substrate-binding protein [Ignatzschineria rhizosphaerae]UNM97393.1 ABC transporter substrate-binding protein [Ignatzschineria rhizosphaerae]
MTQISYSNEYEALSLADKQIHVERNNQAIAAIPPNFQFVTQGALTVAVAPSDPPISFYAKDAKTAIGADPDFALAIAESLGLDLKLIPITWIDWSLGLTSKKYDVVLANIGVTEERKAKFDFSTYRLGLHGFYVKNSSKITSIVEPKDAAGLRIIVGAGTNQERILLRWNEALAAKNLPPIKLQYYDDGAISLLAIQSDRADVIVQPNAQLVYLAARDGNIRSVGTLSAGWPDRSDVAVVTRKNSGLADAITLAINGLIQEGSYQKILDTWYLGEEALKVSETNPPGLPVEK